MKKEYSELELDELELEFIEEKDLEEVVGGIKIGSLYIEKA
nr:hypothetical protein [uncultured Lachnoclostridium sp.]